MKYIDKVKNNIDYADERGMTLLHLMAISGYSGGVSLFLDVGANADVQDLRGNTPLHYAAKFGNVDSINELIESGANIHVKNFCGKTAADEAKTSGQSQIAVYLSDIPRINPTQIPPRPNF